MKKLSASVYIVGAGPGNPDLLTVRAQNILMNSDLILFADSLVPQEILQICKPDAEIIRTANKTLETIIPIMIEGVRSKKSVARLHSGDPSLYSAIHEQIQLLRKAGVPFEIVPGISAFQAAAASLKVELTIPGLVQTIILTRVSGRTEVPAKEELSSLASHQASLCLYLAAHHVENAQVKLLEHYAPDTPVAILYRLGWNDEKIKVVSLDQITNCTYQENLTRTTLYVISPALRGFIGDNSTQFPVEIAQQRSQLYHPEHTHLFRPRG
ncbi:Cobalt-precorrin-4 C11-methyltransferase [Richelia intracellularis HM01]|uniref:precorrin-4 C(11)-methyltransferase n=1 Tax=Richelia intracellularis TaxID=1164990 RepID=UPI0002B5137C|nr:precorrin-4 C(11)-methyltransferase [Richelia intracellularis]CCH65526.1 Cobalt-precorrin-4 C11-methyltransferase [Richelia intracellularis HM01]